MSINIKCPKCSKTHRLKTRKCSCGNNLSRYKKYRVRVKSASGWKSKIVSSLVTAHRINREFMNQKYEEDILGIPVKAEAPLLETIWPIYLTWAKLHKKSWRTDQYRWDNQIGPTLGRFKMDKIKPYQVQTMLNKMHGAYAPATIRQELVLVKRLYNWSKGQGLYEGVNPCDSLKAPKFDNKVTNPLDRDGLQRLMNVLDAWSNERATLVIRFALYSGKRKGEILGLQWPDVCLNNARMTLHNTKNGSTQSLPLNKHCLEILQRCHQMRSNNSSYVFISRRGAPYNGGGFDKTWRRIREKARINIRFHDLRHTFASYLASSGKVDIYTLKELLGHSTIEMTQRYAHLVNGALRKAVEVADEVFY